MALECKVYIEADKSDYLRQDLCLQIIDAEKRYFYSVEAHPGGLGKRWEKDIGALLAVAFDDLLYRDGAKGRRA